MYTRISKTFTPFLHPRSQQRFHKNSFLPFLSRVRLLLFVSIYPLPYPPLFFSLHAFKRLRVKIWREIIACCASTITEQSLCHGCVLYLRCFPCDMPYPVIVYCTKWKSSYITLNIGDPVSLFLLS